MQHATSLFIPSMQIFFPAGIEQQVNALKAIVGFD